MKYLPSVDTEELPDRLIFMHTFIKRTKKGSINVSRHIFKGACATSFNPVVFSAVNGVIQKTDWSKAYRLYSLILQLE